MAPRIRQHRCVTPQRKAASWGLRALALALPPLAVSAEWAAHSLVGLDLTGDAGPYSKLFFDPAWAPFGRIVLLPGTLEIVQPCVSGDDNCTNCSVAFSPDARLWSFPIDPSLQPGDPIAVALSTTTNVGPELLTPEATVYVPPRAARPPLLISDGGAWVNECATTPYVIPWYTWGPSRGYASPFRTSSWCLTPAFATHVLRLDTLEWVHLNATGPDSLSSVLLNRTGLFGMGVTATYEPARDRVLLTAGYISNDVPTEVGNAALSMDLSVLCGDATQTPPPAASATTAAQGYSPSDLQRWSAGPLRTDRLQWVQATAYLRQFFSFGMFAIDPVRDRAVQYGGTDVFLQNSNLNCFTLDLATLQWGDGGRPEPRCSYGVTWVGPFYVWGAASVVLPERRQALLFGGRQSPGATISRFNVLDAHWALDLDDLTWEYLSSTELFWGLPPISGAHERCQRLWVSWCHSMVAALSPPAAGASAVAVPLPDNSTALFLWGGISVSKASNSNPNVDNARFQCGFAARAQLAYPSAYGPGAVGSIYSVVLPPAAAPRAPRPSPPVAAPTVAVAVPLALAIAAVATLAGAHLLLLFGCSVRLSQKSSHLLVMPTADDDTLDRSVEPATRLATRNADISADTQHAAPALRNLAASSCDGELPGPGEVALPRAAVLQRHAGIAEVDLANHSASSGVSSLFNRHAFIAQSLDTDRALSGAPNPSISHSLQHAAVIAASSIPETREVTLATWPGRSESADSSLRRGDPSPSALQVRQTMIFVAVACAFTAHACLAAIVAVFLSALSSVRMLDKEPTFLAAATCAVVSALAAAAILLSFVFSCAAKTELPSCARSVVCARWVLHVLSTLPALVAAGLTCFGVEAVRGSLGGGARFSFMAVLATALCDALVTLTYVAYIADAASLAHASDTQRSWLARIRARAEARRRQREEVVQGAAVEPLLAQERDAGAGATGE